MAFIEIGAEQQAALAARAKTEAPDKTGGGKKIPVEWMAFKPDTEYTVRVLPPWTTEGYYAYSPYIQINQHWDVGPDGKRVVCPKNTPHVEGDSCYICEQVKALFASGDKQDEKRARRMHAGKNFIYQIIDRGDEFWSAGDEKIAENPELAGQPKVKLMRLSYSAHRQVLDLVADAEFGNITSVVNGRDIKIARRGSGINTEYGVLPKPKEKPLFDDPAMVELAGTLMNELDKHPFFRAATYDETRAIYLGQELPKDGHNQLGGSAPRGQLSDGGYKSGAPTGDAKYKQWKDQNASGEPLDRAGLSAKMGWEDSDIPPCYGVEPDHQDNDCWRCPAKAQCSSRYAQDNGGRYSVNAPAEAAPTGGFGKGGFGKGSTPNPPDDDDIPF